jgi:hypothetical protein
VLLFVNASYRRDAAASAQVPGACCSFMVMKSPPTAAGCGRRPPWLRAARIPLGPEPPPSTS